VLKELAKAIIPAPARAAMRRTQNTFFAEAPKPPQIYQGVSTVHSTAHLYSGRFGQAYERHWRLDPYNLPSNGNRTRLRIYNVCSVARIAMRAEGDVLSAGISYAVAPSVLYDFLDIGESDRKLVMIDPFLGVDNSRSMKVQEKYNTDEAFVRDRFPPGARIEIIRDFIPAGLPPGARYCFVHMNTTDEHAEARALPLLWPQLSKGGAIVIDMYAIDGGYQAAYAAAMPVEPFVLPTGQAVLFKP